jgi:hypothetical protein
MLYSSTTLHVSVAAANTFIREVHLHELNRYCGGGLP